MIIRLIPVKNAHKIKSIVNIIINANNVNLISFLINIGNVKIVIMECTMIQNLKSVITAQAEDISLVNKISVSDVHRIQN